MSEKPFSQNLRERFLKSTPDSVDSKTSKPTKRLGGAEVVSEMLGFVGRVAVETVTADIQQMLKQGMRAETDGYILALSRIMEHDLAWECIIKAFGDHGESVPVKYYPQFGKKPDQGAKPKKRMVVQ